MNAAALWAGDPGQDRGAVLNACYDCGLIHSMPEAADGRTVACIRCGAVLRRYRPGGITRAFALNLAALLLFGVANSLPLLTMKLAGREQAATLFEGVIGLHRAGMWELALLVMLVAIVFPLVVTIGTLWVLWHLRTDRVNVTLAPVMRTVDLMRPWAMTEVYLLGLIVAWVKLRDLATIELGLALGAFVTFIVVMIWAGSALDTQEVWDRIAPQARVRPGKRISDGSLLACHACGQLVRPTVHHEHSTCPRCRSDLHVRKPDSIARAAALVIAAAILYVPANLYPVMEVVSLGRGEPDTIISGVKALVQLGMYPVALLVFFASITVPVLKLIGLTYLIVSVKRGSNRRRRDRTVLYRMIESVGRWSMVDIFMISILVALVNLQEIATIEPGAGAVAFASVVILTMIASHSFDPRLIWDSKEDVHDGAAHANRP
jgi:paraquat-inducible protein A